MKAAEAGNGPDRRAAVASMRSKASSMALPESEKLPCQTGATRYNASANRSKTSMTVGRTNSMSGTCSGFSGGRFSFSTKPTRSEEHTSELQSLMRHSYAVFCLKKKNTDTNTKHIHMNIHT